MVLVLWGVAGLIAFLIWLRPMPESLREYFADFDPDECAAALPAIRRALWLHLAVPVYVGLVLVVLLRIPDEGPSTAGWIAIGALGFGLVAGTVLLCKYGAARYEATAGVGVDYGLGLPPTYRPGDYAWWQLHAWNIVLGRWWALCRRRRADAVLFVAFSAALCGLLLMIVVPLVLLIARTLRG
jgi:hypothetical protein